MASAAKLAWENTMREHGYVPARERVANLFKGVYNAGKGTYKVGTKTCKIGWKAGTGICTGLYIGGRTLFRAGRKVYGVGKKAYEFAAPKVKEVHAEIKKDIAEKVATGKFAKTSEEAKSQLELMLNEIEAQKSPDCEVEITDVPGTPRNYGNAYEVAGSRVDAYGRNVPTGVLVDTVNQKFYRY